MIEDDFKLVEHSQAQNPVVAKTGDLPQDRKSHADDIDFSQVVGTSSQGTVAQLPR